MVVDTGLTSGGCVVVPTGLFINNEFVPSVDGHTLDVESPVTGEKAATIATASANDVNKAVAAAQAALPGWRRVLPTEKTKLLWKLAELLEDPQNQKVFSAIEKLDMGATDSMTKQTISDCISCLRYFAGWADKLGGKTLSIPGGTVYTLKEPIGVCAGIVAWNSPLLLSTLKLAPALATGNVIIVKTPELAPLDGIKLAQLVKEAGFPPGVVSIMTGEGRVAGQAIAEHMDIRKVSFTGGGATARKIMAAAAASNMKRLTFELGGKSPSIVFDDAQLENAVTWTFLGFTANSGQICVAGSRIYVQEGIYDRFLEAFKKKLLDAAEAPVSAKTPVISKLQHDKVLSYIESGTQEGANILGGGNKVGDKGYFIQPTAFIDVKPDAKIMREEIFGPVTVCQAAPCRLLRVG